MAWTRLRQDIKAETLRDAAKTEKNSNTVRRLLGIAHLLDGGTRCEAQKICCLTINVFRIWMKRFNEQGIDGLKSKPSTGRPVKLSKEIIDKLQEKVLSGPSAAEHLVRYRIVDLQKFLQDEYKISMCQSGLWYNLQNLKLSWKTGRQRHPKSDHEAQEAFKKTSVKS